MLPLSVSKKPGSARLSVGLDRLDVGGVQDDEADTPRHKLEDGRPVAVWKCQAVTAATQASFVVGSVLLKNGLKYVDEERGEAFSPIVYALAREACAGPILLLLAWAMAGHVRPKRVDAWRVGVMGAAMFLSQLMYILGIELSGVAVATCMQPAIPVITVMLGIALKMEGGSPRKLAGIALAVLGAVAMVGGGAAGAAHSSSADAAQHMLLGDLCLLLNTLAMAVYYILSKQMVARYPAICVAAWAYLVAASCMALAALAFTDAADWRFPRALLGPLVYWILVCSVAGYYAVTWAMRHLPASQVAAFQCLQPMLGTLAAFLFLNEAPTLWDLGALGIVAGLLLVTTERRQEVDMPALLARVRRLLSQPRSLSAPNLRALALARPGGGGGDHGGGLLKP